jgi:hypothetical protein
MRCQICLKNITDKDRENNNREMKMGGIGTVHRKCKISTENLIINSSFDKKNLEDEMKRL